MLPKIHKPNNRGRPIVNGTGSVTEKILAYVDQEIRHLVPSIPSYLKDTSHLIYILLGKNLAPGDILVTIDVKSLYTNIPHTEGIQALKKDLRRNKHTSHEETTNMQACQSSTNKKLFLIQQENIQTDARNSYGNKNSSLICKHIHEICRNATDRHLT